MPNLINLDSFSAVGAGETANLVLSINPIYQQIHLETNVPDKIKRVRLSLSAEEIFSLEKTELDMLQSYDQIAKTDGYITLPLSLDYATLLEPRLTTALVTGPGDNPVLEVEIDSTASAPKLKAFAEVGARGAERYLVRKFVRYTIPVAAEGDVDFNTLVRGPNIRILRMFFKGKIEALEIKRDGIVLYEVTKARNDFLLKRAGKTAPNGYFVFDPTLRNFPLAEAMSTTANNLNFKLKTKGGAQNIGVLVDQMYSSKTIAKRWA